MISDFTGEILDEFGGALERQRARGAYALLHANGMPFDEMVELIQMDTAAIMLLGDDPMEGDGHGDIA